MQLMVLQRSAYSTVTLAGLRKRSTVKDGPKPVDLPWEGLEKRIIDI